MTEQLGDRGLTTIRRFGKAEFESLYGSKIGFDSAYLCYSEHHAWGARNDGVRVLEIFMDLDLVPNSYAIDKPQDHPRLVIHPDFMDRLRSLFSIFYSPENDQIFTENSTLATAFEGSKDFDWKTPEVIAIYMNFHIDGEPQVFPLMENANDWDDEEEEVEFEDAAEYIEYCSRRYTIFLDDYEQTFDDEGRPRAQVNCFNSDQDAEAPEFLALRAKGEAQPIEKVGRELRKLFSWLRQADTEKDYVEGSAGR